MRKVEPWDVYFLKMADLVATRSKDPSTQVGCVIVNDEKQVLSTGYNGMPPGVKETPELWERPTKYDFVVHAEENAVVRAARFGVALNGSTAYVTMFPCHECAKTLITAGVRRVVLWWHGHPRLGYPKDGWEKSFEKSDQSFRMAGIDVVTQSE